MTQTTSYHPYSYDELKASKDELLLFTFGVTLVVEFDNEAL